MYDFQASDNDGDLLTVTFSRDIAYIRTYNGATVTLGNADLERLYEALGAHLYGDLDEYDADAIRAAESRREAIMQGVADLIGYKMPEPEQLRCDGDTCGKVIHQGDTYYHHHRLNANLHPYCYENDTVKHETVNMHCIEFRNA
jgi:hypothetical protein